MALGMGTARHRKRCRNKRGEQSCRCGQPGHELTLARSLSYPVADDERRRGRKTPAPPLVTASDSLYCLSFAILVPQDIPFATLWLVIQPMTLPAVPLGEVAGSNRVAE